MTTMTLADIYRAARLMPGPEIMGLRQAPFEDMKTKIDTPKAVELARLYFGMKTTQGLDGFVETFSKSDPSFSLYDNEREAAVLAAALLYSRATAHKPGPIWALLAAAAAGQRMPVLWPDLIVTTKEMSQAASIARRDADRGQPQAVTILPKPKPGEIAEGHQVDWASVNGMVKKAGDDSFDATKNLSAQVNALVKPLLATVEDLKEESQILWWCIGGWSRILEKPFTAFTQSTAALLAGLDVADLARDLHGPAAAAVLIDRIASTGKKPKAASIKEAVEGLSDSEISSIAIPVKVKEVEDICPVLTALSKVEENGRGSGWQNAFTKITGLDPSAPMDPMALGMQAYRERMLVYSLGN